MKFATTILPAIVGSAFAQNDYTDYDYTWGHTDIPVGSAVWSGIPKLPAYLRKKLKIVQGREKNEDFINTLKSIQNHPGFGGIFGDMGYENPGHGGVGNFDIFALKETMTLSVFGQFYVKTDNNSTSCDPEDLSNPDANCEVVDFEPSGYGAMENSWWSLPHDSKNLTVVESKNQVSQVCWDKGDGEYNTWGTVMDQLMICEFEEGTNMMVAMGLWRATQGELPDVIAENGCDPLPDGQEWDHPQKVVSPNVYQYLIPYGHNSDSPVNIKSGSCFICPNKDTVNATMQQYYDGECWNRDDLYHKKPSGKGSTSLRGANSFDLETE